MFEVGSVIYVYNDKIKPGNHKFMVCVVVENGFYLCINTENRKLYECIPIAQKNNTYLKYDSFISCNRIFHFEPSELKQAKQVGHLDHADLKRLKDHIANNVKTLSRLDKQRILQSLDNVLIDYL